jgi:5-methylcytosine-specific restriction protein A
VIKMMRPNISTFGGNADNRPNASGRGYGGSWKAAAGKFKRAHPCCLGCAALNRKVATAVVDHVLPHRGDREVFWNASMWQPACRWHHEVVKKKLEHLFLQGTIAADALWLDSGAAVSISIRLRARDVNIRTTPEGG